MKKIDAFNKTVIRDIAPDGSLYIGDRSNGTSLFIPTVIDYPVQRGNGFDKGQQKKPVYSRPVERSFFIDDSCSSCRFPIHGTTDWRLPDVIELVLIFELGKAGLLGNYFTWQAQKAWCLHQKERRFFSINEKSMSSNQAGRAHLIPVRYQL